MTWRGGEFRGRESALLGIELLLHLCIEEIRPPPSQKPVSWELEGCSHSLPVTHNTVRHPVTTGSIQPPNCPALQFSVTSECYRQTPPPLNRQLSRHCVCVCAALCQLQQQTYCRGPVGLSLLLSAFLLLYNSKQRACNSWPPAFILISTYQGSAGCSYSSSSHIPALPSTLPHRAHAAPSNATLSSARRRAQWPVPISFAHYCPERSAPQKHSDSETAEAGNNKLTGTVDAAQVYDRVVLTKRAPPSTSPRLWPLNPLKNN